MIVGYSCAILFLARALVHVRGMENVAAMADIKGTFVLNAMMAIMKTLTTLVKVLLCGLAFNQYGILV